MERVFRFLLPSPFSLAVLLTFLTLVLGMVFAYPELSAASRASRLLADWNQGLWDGPMLVFAVQMMLILVLGHALALSAPARRLIGYLVEIPRSGATAAALVAVVSVITGLLNWGLGLILGAVLAREMATSLQRRSIPYSYAVLGAAGYLALLVFHGGLSGSAPLKAAEPGHLGALLGFSAPEGIPDVIPMNETVLHTANITGSILLILLLGFLFYLLGSAQDNRQPVGSNEIKESTPEKGQGAERMDRGPWIARLLSALLLLRCGYLIAEADGLNFLTPNFLNQAMLGLGLWFHRNVGNYLKAVDEAIGGASGILLQFPLYFGIMGLLRYSGLLEILADTMVSNIPATLLPYNIFVSSGLVNILVPSGGGQWSVQGPVILRAAHELGLPLNQAVMALAYGDQLTNMLQPFWALPLLSITGLKAREVLPYTATAMLMAALVFAAVLALW